MCLDTLEQIDVSLNLIEKYDDTFQLCKTADDVMSAIGQGKVASLLGLEGCVMA
jgi:membrane dipeptidase